MKKPFLALLFGGITVIVAFLAFSLGQANKGNPSMPSAVSIFAPAKPALPVAVTYRKSLLGHGYVIGIHNTSNNALAMNVTLKNPTFKTEKVYQITIEPFAQQELGFQQGWTGAVGDTIEVESSGFAPYNGSIPQ